jgi:hypothetical protein
MPKTFKAKDIIEKCNNFFNKLEELEQQAESVAKGLQGLRQEFEEEMPTDDDIIEVDDEE